MAIFNLWLPVVPHAREVCFDVTRGNIPELDRGSREWVTEALYCLGISCEPLDWTIKPWRSQYFSDYPDYESWEDRWRVGWTVAVSTKGEVSLQGSPLLTPVAFDQLDSSWDGNSQPKNHNGRALILAYRKRQENSARAATFAELVEQGLPRGLVVESFGQRKVHDAWTEFRTMVTGEVFPNCAQGLDSLVSLIKGQGLIVDWQEGFSKIGVR